MGKIGPYLKAVVGFLIPGALALIAAAQYASPSHEHITGGEWLAALAACIVTGGAVFAVPNRDPRGRHQAESVQPPEAGYGAVELLVGVLVVVILLVVLFRLV